MMNLRTRRIALLALTVLWGCTSHQVPLAQLAPDVLYTRGTAAFREEKYGKAVELLDAFVQNHPGDPRLAEARMMLGRALIERQEYLTAASELQRLVAQAPGDTLAPQARLLTCDAYYRLSPKPPLDQDYTQTAITYCQSVAQLYPQTPLANEATQRVAELRHKLAQKAYDTGVFYFRRGAYDAAVVYLARAVDTYPDTTVAPAALLKLVQSYGRIGYKEEEAEARARLARDYPESAEARELRG